MLSKRSLEVLFSVFLMALLTLTMSVPLLPASNAQEYIAVPTTKTEYPWTYVLGHCTPDGNYPCTSCTPGPGPLSDHVLWTAPQSAGHFVCANGRLYNLPYAYDAATGEQLWYNEELAEISLWISDVSLSAKKTSIRYSVAQDTAVQLNVGHGSLMTAIPISWPGDTATGFCSDAYPNAENKHRNSTEPQSFFNISATSFSSQVSYRLGFRKSILFPIVTHMENLRISI